MDDEHGLTLPGHTAADACCAYSCCWCTPTHGEAGVVGAVSSNDCRAGATVAVAVAGVGSGPKDYIFVAVRMQMGVLVRRAAAGAC